MKPVRTIVLAKAPQPGYAKTRLIPALGAEGAAHLARCMLDDTLDYALAAGLGPIELRVSPMIDAPDWQAIPIPAGIEVAAQGDGDLGARLARAAECAINRGESILLIGTDCVEMSDFLLKEAAGALEQYDAIIYSTADGGYALLGLNRYHPMLFSDIAWSTDTVAFETIFRIAQLGWSLHIGTMLHDIDEPEDLYRLPKGWVQAWRPEQSAQAQGS